MPALPIHHTETSPAAWDASTQLKRLGDSPTEAALRTMHAWIDPDADPATKTAYKLPHHEVSAEGRIGPANMRACSSAIGVLNGARGGVDIPAEDRERVHAHLAAHMKDAGMEAPPLRAAPGLPALEMRAYPLEVRLSDGDGMPILEGHAAVFDSLSLPLQDWRGAFRERIRPGAFDRTLAAGADVALLAEHDGLPLARTSSGTLRLQPDDRGLYFRTTLDTRDPLAMSMRVKVERGDIRHMSFAFVVNDDTWRQVPPPEQASFGALWERILNDVDLDGGDISLVRRPAYPDTDVATRSLQAHLQTQGGLEVVASPREQGLTLCRRRRLALVAIE